MSMANDENTLHTALLQVLVGAGINDPYSETEDILRAAELEAAEEAQERALAMARSRAAGTPLSYVLGYQRFMDVDIAVSPGVLIPRPETELLGWEAVVRLREVCGEGRPMGRAIDMCCGSGNLACGIASALPEVQVWASDLMDECIDLAAHNVRRHGLQKRVFVAQGDLFEWFFEQRTEQFDIVVCNPPYIPSHRLARDRKNLLHYEPRTAFDGGPYGLSIYQRLLKDAAHFLKPGAWLLLEMGLGQSAEIERLVSRTDYYDKVELVTDHRGDFRVAAIRRQGT